MAGSKADRRRQAGRAPALLEWVAGAIGLALAIGIVAVLAHDALRNAASKPPLLQVRPTGINSDGGLHMVEVTVLNRSGQTAADVEIKGTLSDRTGPVETSSASLTYVPGNSTRKVGLIFRRDPRSFALTVIPGGYELP